MLRIVCLGLVLGGFVLGTGCGSSGSGDANGGGAAGATGVAGGGSGGVGGSVGVGGSGGVGGGGLGGSSGVGGGGGVGVGGSGGVGASGGGGPARIRIVAANLSSGTMQNYTSGEGLRILQGVAPDVVLIQELTYQSSSDADIQAFTDQVMGTPAHFARESGAQLPNGILSRYPIVQSGDWVDPSVSNRGFLWAQIDIPGDDLWVFSVHLLTSGATQRDTEAKALVQLIKDNTPAGSYLALGGDFNTSVRDEPCIATLSALFDVAAPYPADGAGNDFTNGPRSKPHDWVLPDPSLRALEVPVVIGQSTFANGLVFDSRVYTPLDDVAPVMMGDSGATGMQHMAVVRDFVVPGPLSTLAHIASAQQRNPTSASGGSATERSWITVVSPYS